MERRQFILGTTTAFLAGARLLEGAADDVADVRAAIEKVYRVYYQVRDKSTYRELLTDDYYLLEHGQLMDIAADMALIPAPGPGYQRTDIFDFRSTQVHGDTAYAIYFLRTDIADQKGQRHIEFLESAVMRRERPGSPWRMALCHSTRIAQPAP